MSRSHQLSFELLSTATRSRSVVDFLERALTNLLSETVAETAAVYAATGGTWQPIATTDAQAAPPGDLLAEAADSETPQAHNDWSAVKLQGGPWPAAVLVVRPAEITSDMGLALSHAVQLVAAKEVSDRRAERLQTILNITGDWNHTATLQTLLKDMAEAASRLLAAERATIFLWDRQTKTLVGRPALGVEGNELRIPDSTGVVGQVLHDAQSRRAGRLDESDQISRDVDQMLQFETRNLVCVPLVNRRGKTIGAFEVLNKRQGDFTGIDETELIELAKHATAAIENCQNYQQLLTGRKQRSIEDAAHTDLIGESPPIAKIRETIDRVAGSDLAVLILGENGTGKEIASRLIHTLSERREQPFVAVNCAAITGTLLESELFGHEKGAFTDAHETRAGKFEAAAGGTLFLDEVAELPMTSQSKLLRVIEDKVVTRVGGTTQIPADARVIAATNQDLAAMVRDRKFREDLFFRLNVVTLVMPPLRERREDIALLADHFLAEFCTAAKRPKPNFSASAIKLLEKHDWPGNVRELRNLMERLAYLSAEPTIDADQLRMSTEGLGAAVSEGLPLSEATRQFQIEYIDQQIRLAAGNMTEAAQRLGLHRSNLYRKMSQLGMNPE